MSHALAKAAKLKPELRLAQAISEFEASLSTQEKSTFRTIKSQSLSAAPTQGDVMRLTAEVDGQISKKFNGQCFGPRFTNFLEGVQHFAALGDVVVGGSQNLIACGVWSLVRMSLLVGISFHVAVDFADSSTAVYRELVKLCRQAIIDIYEHWSHCSPSPSNGYALPSICKTTGCYE
jgi:hypothetical protein